MLMGNLSLMVSPPHTQLQNFQRFYISAIVWNRMLGLIDHWFDPSGHLLGTFETCQKPSIWDVSEETLIKGRNTLSKISSKNNTYFPFQWWEKNQSLKSGECICALICFLKIITYVDFCDLHKLSKLLQPSCICRILQGLCSVFWNMLCFCRSWEGASHSSEVHAQTPARRLLSLLRFCHALTQYVLESCYSGISWVKYKN